MSSRYPPYLKAGRRLKAARLLADMSQVEASSRAKVQQAHWSHCEAGWYKPPTVEQAERMAKAVNVTAEIVWLDALKEGTAA